MKKLLLSMSALVSVGFSVTGPFANVDPIYQPGSYHVEWPGGNYRAACENPTWVPCDGGGHKLAATCQGLQRENDICIKTQLQLDTLSLLGGFHYNSETKKINYVNGLYN